MTKSKELCSETVCIAPRFGKESMCEYHHKKWEKSWDDYNKKFLHLINQRSQAQRTKEMYTPSVDQQSQEV